MINYSVLGSGSSGNSYLIGHQGEALLIDSGFSYRELKSRLEVAGYSPNQLKGLCLTHLHPDHSRGAGVFARQSGKAVFVNEKVVQLEEVVKLNIPNPLLETFQEGESFLLPPFEVTPFRTHHDSPNSVGFAVEVAGKRLVILTDTGLWDEEMVSHVENSDLLFLEANYDEEMLENGPYPYFLKERIRGERGHLSNCEAIELLNSLKRGPEKVYFCHLSKTNNHPQVVLERCNGDLEWSGEVVICHHGEQYNGTL